MAQTISLISGSPFAGCPIVYDIQPNSYAASHTFHRVITRVYARLEGDTEDTVFESSQPVYAKAVSGSFVTQPAEFDVSSALQAIAERYEYTPEPPGNPLQPGYPDRYPYIKFRIEAWDEWIENGVVYQRQNVVGWPYLPTQTYQFYAYAFMGSFNDLERMGALVDGNGVEYLNITYLSRKPTTQPEIVFKSTPWVYPSAWAAPGRSLGTTDAMSGDPTPVFVSGAPTDGPKSLIHTPASGGSATVGGHSIFAIDRPANGYELRFVNGMGCLESLHVTSRARKNANIQTEEYVISRRETLKKFSRKLTVKTADKEVWTLTSGPLDEAWASWYVHEFLKAQLVWIKIGTQWIQCHVLPEETESIIDPEASQMLRVQFNIELDLVY